MRRPLRAPRRWPPIIAIAIPPCDAAAAGVAAAAAVMVSRWYCYCLHIHRSFHIHRCVQKLPGVLPEASVESRERFTFLIVKLSRAFRGSFRKLSGSFWEPPLVLLLSPYSTAELDADSRHFSSSKHIYDRACCVLLIFSVCDLTLRPVTPTLHEIRATRPHPGPELGLTLA